MSRIIAGGKYATFYTATFGTTPTVGTTAVYTCQDQISSDVSMDGGSGAWTLTIDNVQDDATLNTFVETYRDYSISNVETLTEEDGTVTLASSTKTLLAIVKGGLNTGGAQKVIAMPCVLALDAGAFKQEGGKYTRPKLTFKGINTLGTVTLLTAVFSGHMVTATQSTFGTSQKYGRIFFG